MHFCIKFWFDYCSGVNIGPYYNRINVGLILRVGPYKGNESSIG